MKKEAAKTILSSAVSIALSAALIAGSTFALFTGQSNTDISITSGNVDVTATASISRVYSAEWKDGEGYTNKNLYEGETYQSGKEYNFSNGGTVTYSGGTVTIESISPGDGVVLKIEVQNSSTISIRYQMRLGIKDTVLGPNGEKLSDYLDVKFNSETVSGEYGVVTDKWSESIDPGAKIEPFTVEISLPIDTETEYQSLSTDLTVGVYAVQGNASDSTPLADVIVNSADGLHAALDDFAKSDETDLVLGLMDDMTISDETPLTVPENKDLTLDVGGNSVAVDKQILKDDSLVEGDSLVVPEGSTLTITDSGKSGGFDLHLQTEPVDFEHEPGKTNYYAGAEGNYALRVEKGGTLNLKNVDFNIEGAELNHSIYVDGGTVNADAETNINFTGDYASTAFVLNNGAEMNLNGATMASDGTVCQVIVGKNGAESTLNINAGTEIVYENASNSGAALQVYPSGNINIHEGSKITVCGDLTNEGDAQYSDSSAIRAVAGGVVNMDGGEIVLNAEKGWAYAIYATSHSNSEKYFLHAYITLSGTAKITAIGNPPQTAHIFGAQKNYDYIIASGSTIPDVDENGELRPTITIGKTVTITWGGKVVKKEDKEFAYTDNGQGFEFFKYTLDAIKDERVFD